MSGNKLLDTNILIYLSKNELSLASFAKPDDELYISIITYMEALGYAFTLKTEENLITSLCKNLIVINLNTAIVEEVIQIRRNKKIKLPDAIIAATASINKFDLVTRNTEDFKSVKTYINIINPFTII